MIAGEAVPGSRTFRHERGTTAQLRHHSIPWSILCHALGRTGKEFVMRFVLVLLVLVCFRAAQAATRLPGSRWTARPAPAARREIVRLASKAKVGECTRRGQRHRRANDSDRYYA
jgi:hypothetical protein